MERVGLSRLNRRDFLIDTSILTGGTLLFPEDALRSLSKFAGLPPKRREDGVRDFLVKHQPLVRNRGPFTPPLDIVRATPLISSPIGLVNAEFLGYNMPEKMHFSFPIDPANYKLHNDRYWFLTMTNSASEKKPVRPFRKGETYLEMIEEFFNTAMWLLDSQGGKAEAIVVVELNYKHRPESICAVAMDLYEYGFNYQTYGNEFDLAGGYEWRNRPGMQEDALRDVRNCRDQESVKDMYISPAAVAFRENSGLRQEVALLGLPESDYDFIPMHLYPPIFDSDGVRDYKGDTKQRFGINSYINQLDQVRRRNRLMNKDIFIREMGFPGADRPETQFREDQLAECHLPAVLMLSVGSKKIKGIYWYNLHSMGQPYQSLASFIEGEWIVKSTYDAWEYNAKLLGNLEDINIFAEKDYTLVKILRKDGVEAVVGWANGTKRVVLERPEGVIVTDAYGIQRFESRVVLEPSPAPPVLVGSARYMIKRGSLDLPKAAGA